MKVLEVDQFANWFFEFLKLKKLFTTFLVTIFFFFVKDLYFSQITVKMFGLKF